MVQTPSSWIAVVPIQKKQKHVCHRHPAVVKILIDISNISWGRHVKPSLQIMVQSIDFKQTINHRFLNLPRLCHHHTLGVARHLDHQQVIGCLRIAAPTAPLGFRGAATADGNGQRPFEFPFLAGGEQLWIATGPCYSTFMWQ